MFRQQHHDWLRGFRRNLFSYSCALCTQKAAAEDLYHDALVRALSAKSVPTEAVAFRVWMFRLLRNLWIDALRADARAQTHAQSEQAGDGDGRWMTGADDAVVNRLAVRQAFMQLGKDHRDVLALVDIGGFSYEETGMLLAIPKGTVMSRVARARAALARALADDQVIAFPPRRKAGR
ncbi:MAG: RNA polymerase sigma factor [Pararhodobacter sp.]